MLSAIISADYLEAMHVQKALDYTNLKSLVYQTDFQIIDHYDFLYHDGFFIFIKDPTERHLNFCLHISMITSGKPLFVLIDGCNLALLNKFKETLKCRIFIAPFAYRRIATLYEAQRGPFLDSIQKFEKDSTVFELDPGTRHLIFNGKSRVKLNNKEFFILKFLFSNQQKIVSKIDLFEYVWGKNLLGSVTTVDTHMSKLRKKIKHHTKDDLIQTVPCAGYMLK